MNDGTFQDFPVSEAKREDGSVSPFNILLYLTELKYS